MSLQFKSIGEFAKVKGGKRLPKGEDVIDEPSGFPYIRVTDMGVNGIEQSQVKFISQAVQEKIKRYTISVDDVYISIAGTIGRVGIVPYSLNNANLTENAAKITNIDSSYNPKFLMYFLRSYLGQSQILAKTGGTSQPKLALNRIEEIKCPYLKRRDQDSIAKIISNYDNLIENNKRRIALLEESARLLYREWFVHFRFPGHEHVKIIDGLPEGWKKTPLKAVITLNYGKSLTADSRKTGAVPVYGSSGNVGLHNVALVEGPGIILGRKGNVGSVYWVSSSYWPIDTVYFVNQDEANLYLFYVLKNVSFINTDVAVPGLNRDLAYSREVLVPDSHTKNRFIEEVTLIHNQIEKLYVYNKKLEEARDILLPRLMNGDLAV